MGKYQAYSEYKDSGIEWVGETPIHWHVKPLFSVAATESVKNTAGQETNVLSLSYGNIIPRVVETNFGLLPASFNTYQFVNPGDLVLRLTDLQNDKRSLRVGHAKQSGIITSAYLKLIAKSHVLNDRYLYRLLHSYDTTKVFYGMGGGLRQSMTFEEMRRLAVLVPTLQEQKIIANFLDHETAKIDILIDKQQQLIQLLKEKRQAVISHAVTKGLNPSAPMRDSGVEWLGEVPEHWEMLKGAYIGRLFGSESVSENDVKSSGNVPFIKVSTLSLNDFQLGDMEFYLDTKTGKSYSTRNNYIVFPKRGAAIFTNKVNIVTVDSVIDPNLMGWEIGNKARVEFIAYLLKLRGLEDIADVSTVPQINNKHIEPIKFPIPPLLEQDEIIKHLGVSGNFFSNLIKRAKLAIELSKERRTALISAAVTGKIDVRHHASHPTGDVQSSKSTIHGDL